ncbi:unnamed protein product [Miscanthus lutarioriparius]|uniref:Uncharacterized protein n=1 Tax=Miscanthus lutarioriparius TaxID=422564 RepID=A0A811RUJ6_9POAL|nr:unnamed protein product [Miscanthus lutarioriparius]
MRPINSAEHRKARHYQLPKHRRSDMKKTREKQAGGGGAYLTAGSAERVIWNERREQKSRSRLAKANGEEEGRRARIHGRDGGTHLRSNLDGNGVAAAREAELWKQEKEGEQEKETDALKAQVDGCGEAGASASSDAAARRGAWRRAPSRSGDDGSEAERVEPLRLGQSRPGPMNHESGGRQPRGDGGRDRPRRRQRADPQAPADRPGLHGWQGAQQPQGSGGRGGHRPWHCNSLPS